MRPVSGATLALDTGDPADQSPIPTELISQGQAVRPDPASLLPTPSLITASSQPETQLGGAHAEWDSGPGCLGSSELRSVGRKEQAIASKLGAFRANFWLGVSSGILPSQRFG